MVKEDKEFLIFWVGIFLKNGGYFESWRFGLILEIDWYLIVKSHWIQQYFIYFRMVVLRVHLWDLRYLYVGKYLSKFKKLAALLCNAIVFYEVNRLMSETATQRVSTGLFIKIIYKFYLMWFNYSTQFRYNVSFYYNWRWFHIDWVVFH